eukprot:s693_g6.t1
MSKANVDISVRRLAGYHIQPGDKSALEYSRDAAAPILRIIEAILISLRAHVFRPDLPRSQRWCGAQTLDEAVKVASNLSAAADVEPDADMSNLFGDESFLIPGPADSALAVGTSSASEPHGEASDPVEHSWDDDTTLEELMFYQNASASQPHRTFEFLDSDVSDISSVSSSDDDDCDSSDLERQAEIDGAQNACDLVAPSDLAGKTCFRHFKSKKLRLVERTVEANLFFSCNAILGSQIQRYRA